MWPGFLFGISPERVDPGNLIYKTKNTPKVVGACSPDGAEVISAMYRAVLEGEVFTVSCPAVAEMEKILENTYRNINIGLINELAMLCNEMGISIWEVIDAASTKPYGFQPFYPGPGLGGHCIPLDPYYLSWKAREYGFHTSMIESSMMINDRMPAYCVERAGMILNRFRKALNGSRVLVLGVAYKQDIDDYRESPALRVIEELEKRAPRWCTLIRGCVSTAIREICAAANQSLTRSWWKALIWSWSLPLIPMWIMNLYSSMQRRYLIQKM